MTSVDYSPKARSLAAAIAAVAGATLILRVVLRAGETGSVLEAVSYLSQFFTILTNTLIFAMMLAVALGRHVSPQVTKALTIAIAGVGIVYHVALAHLLDLSGLALLADHGVHTFVPALTVVWWLWLAPKEPFRPSAIGMWIVWPLAYCIYILVRASWSGFYPYPFLNLPQVGPGGLALNIVILMVAFTVIGAALTVLAKVLRT